MVYAVTSRAVTTEGGSSIIYCTKGCWCWTHTSHQPAPHNSSEPTARVKAGSEVEGPGTKVPVMMFIMMFIMNNMTRARGRAFIQSPPLWAACPIFPEALSWGGVCLLSQPCFLDPLTQAQGSGGSPPRPISQAHGQPMVSSGFPLQIRSILPLPHIFLEQKGKVTPLCTPGSRPGLDH